MKTLLSIALLLALILSPFCGAAEWEWCTPLQVKQIALATQLATFPLPQRELHTVIGKRRLPHLGGATDTQKKVFGIIALTDPDSPSGYYAVRVYYDLTTERTPEDIPIDAAQVLYYSPEKIAFAYDPDDGIRHVLPDIKKQMAERKLSPIRFAEYFFDVSPRERGANQPVQTTPMAVTPAAAQPARQP